ncbi:hypothetical protein [Chitinophaga alhagiae]|uniref:hypothetical protein n=1 Tax=Chitinophaga alhagiae TaxID=2203219 RepID=UPI0018E59092|nr:hypothetical protein [Chitinophaga alhagiae]
MKQIRPGSLFVASCLALLVTSLSFGIRAGILGQLGVEFHLNGPEIIHVTMVIPMVLIVAFGGLFFYKRGHKIKQALQTA